MAVSGDIWSSTSWPAGWQVDHVATTGSTNADLLAALEAGSADDRSVLAADHQSAGRGRLDRRWEAPPGVNLLVSIALAPVPDPPSLATHRVALAAVRAASALRPDARVTLKWPNDVLLDDVKMAGILAQRCPSREAVVVGLGMNVGWAPDGAAQLGTGHPADVLARLLAAFDDLPDDRAALDAEYRAALGTLGRPVRIELAASTVEGTAIDVDDAGRLVVDTDQGQQTFDVGDVVHLRPA